MTNKHRKEYTLGTRLKKDLRKNWVLYIMLIPVLAYFIVFHYWPMYGVTLAFKDYKTKLGILGSPWIGFDNFERFFSAYNFKNLLQNTITLSIYSLLIGFPIPIIFALCLNYLTKNKLKKTVQMVSYMPHFISTVILCGMLQIFCSPRNGAFNVLLNLLGFDSINFLGKADYFKHIYVWSGVWQDMGWSAIIYISALSGVDYEMHEAAIIDGASKIQRMRYIDIPSITSTIVMLFIMKLGSLMSVGFEKVYLLQNDLNVSKSQIISTYVYEIGLLDRNFSYSTAVSLFNTVINIILLVTSNAVCKKLTKESLF